MNFRMTKQLNGVSRSFSCNSGSLESKGPTSFLHHLVSEQHHFVLLLLSCVQCLHLSPSTARFEQLSNGDTRRPESFCMFPPVTHKLCNLGVWILFMFGTFFFFCMGLSQASSGGTQLAHLPMENASFLCPPARSSLVLIQNCFHSSSNPHLAAVASPGNLEALRFYDDAALQVAFFMICQ